jgi:hypothetical protein
VGLLEKRRRLQSVGLLELSGRKLQSVGLSRRWRLQSVGLLECSGGRLQSVGL